MFGRTGEDFHHHLIRLNAIHSVIDAATMSPNAQAWPNGHRSSGMTSKFIP
jgi:hypothetical protein